MMWILVVLVMSESRPLPTSVTSVPGFLTESACEAAAKKAREDLAISALLIKTSCVRSF
jgi:hypothetical protein